MWFANLCEWIHSIAANIIKDDLLAVLVCLKSLYNIILFKYFNQCDNDINIYQIENLKRELAEL